MLYLPRNAFINLINLITCENVCVVSSDFRTLPSLTCRPPPKRRFRVNGKLLRLETARTSSLCKRTALLLGFLIEYELKY